MPDARKIIFLACLSRFLVWIIAISGFLVEDYDSSASIAYHLNESHNLADFWVKKLFGMFANWDGLYFLGIAEEGYKYEQFHAFFPAVPMVVRAAAELMSFLFDGLLSMHSWFLLLGFLFSNVCFILATLALYRLTSKLFGPVFAFKTGALFCINPASIFMSSIYTESLFAVATFGGVYYLVAHGQVFIASIFFAVGSAARSNGTVAVGFILFDSIHIFGSLLQNNSSNIWVLFRTISCCLLTVIPVLAIGFYGYRFCAS